MSERIGASVVIPTHNGAEYIIEQLDAVAASASTAAYPVEILVVDNQSTDETAALVTKWTKSSSRPARIVEAHDKAGEPYARNVGLAAARSNIILYCDADDAVSSAWVPSLAGALDAHQYATGPVQTTLLNPRWLAEIRGQRHLIQRPLLHDVAPFANGCNMGFQKTTLESLGGFDESFLIACDLEIAIRAWRSNIGLTWVEAAVVQYRLRTTARATFRQAHSYGLARRRIDALVPELVDASANRRALAKRVTWLARNLPRTFDSHFRAKFAWVSGGVLGELQGLLRNPHD